MLTQNGKLSGNKRPAERMTASS